MWWPFKSKTLDEVLDPTTKVKILGVIFHIRKINPLDYMAGSKAVIQLYDEYKTKGEISQQVTANINEKVKSHYSDVFLASVIDPKLKRKNDPNEPGIFVENLFTEWKLAEGLYQAIYHFTYTSKKKGVPLNLLDRVLSRWI